MDHGIEFVSCKCALHRDCISYVCLNDLDIIGNVRYVGAFDRRIVVIVEVIEHGDLMTLPEQSLCEMRADESSAASDQEMHVSLSREPVAESSTDMSFLAELFFCAFLEFADDRFGFCRQFANFEVIL